MCPTCDLCPDDNCIGFKIWSGISAVLIVGLIVAVILASAILVYVQCLRLPSDKGSHNSNDTSQEEPEFRTVDDSGVHA